jgi:hypothetical protein
MDKEYTASEAKAWLNGYDSGLDHGKRIHGNPTKLMMPNMEQTLASFGFHKKKEWVGLNEGELFDLHHELKVQTQGSISTLNMYRIIEAKLKEKNT